MFFFVFCGLLFLLHYYVAFRSLHDARVPQPWNALGWLACALFALSVPATLFATPRVPRETAFVLALIAYSWLGVVFYLWVFWLARDVVRIVVAAVRWLRRQLARVSAALPAADGGRLDVPEDPARRVFVTRAFASGAAFATLGVGALGARSALTELDTPEIAVRLARLPKALDGFRIVQLSDVHVGPLIGSRFLRHVVAETNRLRPDLIVITGDLVDGSVAELRGSVDLLTQLRSRHGTYFVTGNHEYYSGCDPWVLHLRSLGIHVLMNERVAIGEAGDGPSFDLVGVPDHSAGRSHHLAPDMVAAAAGRDPERELVVLAHQPVQLAQSLAVSAGLQLSGHTHGGQLAPFGSLVALTQPFVAGLHREQDTQIYVSRGAGFWGPPMRVLAPAEIAAITLVSG